MSSITKSIGAIVLITAMSSSAFAEGWRHDRHDGYRDHHRENRHRHYRGGDWIAPLVVLGVAGAMIGAASSAERQRSQAIIYEPPAASFIRQTQQTWYYCQSAQQYYPYVQGCAEAWVAVPSTPR
jgi:hypothetical protein